MFMLNYLNLHTVFTVNIVSHRWMLCFNKFYSMKLERKLQTHEAKDQACGKRETSQNNTEVDHQKYQHLVDSVFGLVGLSNIVISIDYTIERAVTAVLIACSCLSQNLKPISTGISLPWVDEIRYLGIFYCFI